MRHSVVFSFVFKVSVILYAFYLIILPDLASAQDDLSCHVLAQGQQRCLDRSARWPWLGLSHPVVKQSGESIWFGNSLVFIFASDTLFDVSQSTLREDTDVLLKTLMQAVQRYRPVRVQISVHTDTVGSEDFNRRLSRERGDKIAVFLWAHGFDRQRIEVKPMAFDEPIADPERLSGMVFNRRVEVCLDFTGHAACMRSDYK